MIQLSEITFSYGPHKVLSEFSLAVPEGGTLLLTGQSGSGKTTLLRLIAGLESPDIGAVNTSGECFGIVFQEDRLCMQMSAKDNLEMIPVHPQFKEKGISACDLLKAFFPEVEESGRQQLFQTVPVSEFSGGMKRRVAIARALYSQSTSLLLDEAFTGLDDRMKLTAMKEIQNYRFGRTLIVVTHDRDVMDAFSGQQVELTLAI